MDSRPTVRRIEESQEARLDVGEAAPGASIRLTALSCVSCQLTVQLGSSSDSGGTLSFVAAREAPLAKLLYKGARTSFASWSHARKAALRGRVFVDGVRIEDPAATVRSGSVVCVQPSHRLVQLGDEVHEVRCHEESPLREAVQQLLPTHAALRKALAKKQLAVDGTLALSGEDHCAPGVVVTWTVPGRRACVYFETLAVLHDSESWAVVVKPPGLLMDGSARRDDGSLNPTIKTLESILPFNLSRSAAPDALPRPAASNRLDQPVGGIVAVAKARGAARQLARAFAEREVRKIYVSLVVGRPPRDAGEISLPIGGKPSSSSYRVLRTEPSVRFGEVSLIELSPHTGRTHQLRIHCAEALGAPMIGDERYGGPSVGAGLFLWATRLELADPETRERRAFAAPPPPKFERLLRQERRVWEVAERAAGGGEPLQSDYIRQLVEARAEREGQGARPSRPRPPN
jgi:23S rRNA-/tRNA-specific pseudouridylate synthase